MAKDPTVDTCFRWHLLSETCYGIIGGHNGIQSIHPFPWSCSCMTGLAKEPNTDPAGNMCRRVDLRDLKRRVYSCLVNLTFVLPDQALWSVLPMKDEPSWHSLHHQRHQLPTTLFYRLLLPQPGFP